MTDPDESKNLPAIQTKSRREQLIDALILNPNNVQEAGRIAGYTDAYVKSGAYYHTVKNVVSSEDFRKAADQYIQGSDLTRKILRVCKIDDKILSMIEKDPEKYVKYGSVPKQIKQHYGLLAPDNTPVETAKVTIKQMNILIQGDFNAEQSVSNAAVDDNGVIEISNNNGGLNNDGYK